jgi:hypothetical protein
MRRVLLGMAILAALVVAPAGKGATLTSEGITATVTASVNPVSLPKRGSAPVGLSISGAISEVDGLMKALTLQLDPQLAVSGAGLATCKPSDVTGTLIARARRKCKAAFVGSGNMTLRSFGPEGPTGDFPASVLFFNGGSSRLLMYTVVGQVTATSTGTAHGHALEVALPVQVGGMLTAFQFHFGKTWYRRGQKVGYLSGRCATGTLRNRIALRASNGGTVSVLLSQPCHGRT